MNEATSEVTAQTLMVKRSAKLKDLSRQVFGRLTVSFLSEHRAKGRKRTRWNCLCACGNRIEVTADNLTGGVTKSCGCYRRDFSRMKNLRHGRSHTTEHDIWMKMWGRCTVQSTTGFKNYGGRGIRVCDRWRDFKFFLSDMGPRSGRLSIDRKNVNGNYEPDNCRWATQREQCRNKRNNHRLTILGETLCIVEWSERSGLKGPTIRYRLRLGWEAQAAVFTPLQR